MCRAFFMILGVALLGVSACAPEAEESPLPRISDAAELVRPSFDASIYDTLSWSSDAAALERGKTVFEEHCQECHGVTGAGEGGYIFGGQTLQPPSWIVSGWSFADSPLALRRYIFAGSVGGMPYWGLTGVSDRDIDAVSRYITEVLRPTYGERPPGT